MLGVFDGNSYKPQMTEQPKQKQKPLNLSIGGGIITDTLSILRYVMVQTHAWWPHQVSGSVSVLDATFSEHHRSQNHFMPSSEEINGLFSQRRLPLFQRL